MLHYVFLQVASLHYPGPASRPRIPHLDETIESFPQLIKIEASNSILIVLGECFQLFEIKIFDFWKELNFSLITGIFQ